MAMQRWQGRQRMCIASCWVSISNFDSTNKRHCLSRSRIIKQHTKWLSWRDSRLPPDRLVDKRGWCNGTIYQVIKWWLSLVTTLTSLKIDKGRYTTRGRRRRQGIWKCWNDQAIWVDRGKGDKLKNASRIGRMTKRRAILVDNWKYQAVIRRSILTRSEEAIG